MHLRVYNEETDFTYITKWIRDERTHMLWCANLLSYPLSMDGLHNYLIEQNLKFLSVCCNQVSQSELSWNEASKSDTSQGAILSNEKEYNGAYVYADEDDHPVGFFIYTVNAQDKSGFLRFIIIDSTLRGKGYGAEMMRELQRFAYNNTGVSSIRLIVFDVNTAARQCYGKAGFTAMENTSDAFYYRDEMWERCMMEHKFIC